MNVRGFLIVRAAGEMRVTKRRVSLAADEVAFPLNVTIPSTWGKVQDTTIEVTMPDPPETRVVVGVPEQDA